MSRHWRGLLFVAAVGAAVWALPPVRTRVTATASRFATAYNEREQHLRASLMSESVPLAR